MAIVFLGLGSNLGNKELNIKKALELIEQKAGALKTVSSFYHSKAWGYISENEFVNIVAEVESTLTPTELLNILKQIEKELGRATKTIFGYEDRVIDIDILFYDNLILNTPELKIPHPLLGKRDFVLYPLAEIAPDFIHPVLNQSSEWLKNKLSHQAND